MRESILESMYKLLMVIVRTVGAVLVAVAIAHPLFAVFGLLFMMLLVMGVALLPVLAAREVSKE